MTPPLVIVEGIRLPSEAECVCAAAVEVASRGSKGCLALVRGWHGGGGVPDCRVRVVFRSVSSKAAASSYGAAGLTS